MVQRKAVNKLGIQSESRNHAVSEKRSSAIRKPSSQNQDSRNKGGSDLTKKMKKARSFKASDMESLGRSLRQEGSRLNKPSSTDSIQKKKKKKKPTPTKVSSSGSPNYMKPTSSSDARKESLQQVSLSSQTPDRSRSPKNLNYSKASSVGALKKTMKVLKKTSSLKPVRPSMKKSCGAALYPKMNVSRATCSSTLKDSKFPASVPLNPGATEVEGTSAMRVCPYTYCSLNGLHHVPLPPLKRFLSARRRLLKTQKSMKLRGLSSPRKNHHGDPNKEIDTGQMGLCVDPMVLESDSDRSNFFIEVYAKPREESGNDGYFPYLDGELQLSSDENFRAFDEISMLRDNETQKSLEGTEIETKEDDWPAENEINHHVKDQDPVILPCLIQVDNAETECCIEGDKSEESESTVESEVVATVSEASDMDWEKETIPFPDDREDFLTSSDDELDLTAASGLDDELGFEQDGSVSGLNEVIFDAVQEEDSTDQSSRVYVPSADGDEASHASNGLTQNQNNAVLYLDYVHAETEFFGQKDDSPAEETEGREASEIIHASSLTGPIADVLEGPAEYSEVMIDNAGENGNRCEGQPLPRDNEEGNADEPPCSADVANEAMTGEQEDGAPEPDPMTELKAAGGGVDFKQKHPDFAGEESESIIPEVDSELSMSDCSENVEHLCAEIEDSERKAEPEGNLDMEFIDESTGHATNEEVEISQCDERPQEKESNPEVLADQSIPPLDHGSFDDQSKVSNTIENEYSAKDPTGFRSSLISSPVLSHEGGSSSAEDFSMRHDNMQIEDNNKSDAIEKCFVLENGETIINSENDSNRLLAKTCTNRRTTISRKRTTKDSEQMRRFNPRPPRFLPVEPDTEAERVDLRHQTMDERKNAEEWMVDYALRQAVTKLAPARKRKVALLVEAFETVMPMPKFETHLGHSAATFTHARPIQACN